MQVGLRLHDGVAEGVGRDSQDDARDQADEPHLPSGGCMQISRIPHRACRGIRTTPDSTWDDHTRGGGGASDWVMVAW